MDTIRHNNTRLTGLEQLRALMEAGTPAPICATLGFYAFATSTLLVFDVPAPVHPITPGDSA